MFVPYHELPKNARVWIYQSNRMFTNKEVVLIQTQAKRFIEQWTRHGQNLKGSFTIKYNQFLILAVDERFLTASGCSIDASVHFVQELEKILHVDMTDKMNISFKDGEDINTVKMHAFKDFAKQQKIDLNTVVFNNMVATKSELETAWEVPASQSWHQRFIK